MGRQIEHSLRQGGDHAPGKGPDDTSVMALGWLSFLSAFCPVHKQAPQSGLARLFIPAINNDCVRFFKNDDGHVCAALIWARLTDEVSERMLFENAPPTAEEWCEGDNLWFLDILAPFGHGAMVARHIARNPPEGPFYFARVGSANTVRKIVRADALRRRGRMHVRFFAAEDGAA